MKSRTIILTMLITCLLFGSTLVIAVPTTAYEAQKVVAGWLELDARPFGVSLGRSIDKVTVFSDQLGQAVYYIVYLQSGGFVIVSGEDSLEPVVAIAQNGTYDPSTDNPLGAMMYYDFTQRVQTMRQGDNQSLRGVRKAQNKWNQLIEAGAAAGGGDDPVPLGGQSGISDPRVDILVQSRWGQTTCCDIPPLACYNYYTPPLPPATPDGDPNNYPCGCVATAMSQVMRYHTYPLGPTAGNTYTISVDGSPVPNVPVRGGDGMGGPYNWGQMVLEPDCTTTLTERQAIGALCFDAGISVNMIYTSGSSTAALNAADWSLVNEFTYNNSIYGSNPSLPELIEMINPNLDYSHPVIVGLLGTNPDHAVVVDGYGYNLGTLYHHINMGWESVQDAWYNFYAEMPDGYTTVYEAVYNIFINDADELISGRVTDAFGNPLVSETVNAQKDTGGTYQAVTNTQGIYVLPNMPSASTYTISVSKPGYSFNDRVVSTSTSTDGTSVCGNVWAVDFVPFGGGTGSNYYVDSSATGNNDGSSWTDAYLYLQDALATASSGDRILVAEGVYKPDQSTADPNGTGNRNDTFQLVSGVEIYGGFPAGGTNLWSDRDIQTYETILRGDIGVQDDNTYNSYHVVTASYTDSATLLDGFTIRDGNGSGGAGIYNFQGDAVIANCTIRNNYASSYAGGVYNTGGGGSTPTFRKCLFTENTGNYGGAMNNSSSDCSVLIEDCAFIENYAGIVGAGLVDYDGVATVINTQFIRNAADESGGAIYTSGEIHVINCIFEGNSNVIAYGGAFRCQVCSGEVTNCLFVGNVGKRGAGAWNYRPDLVYTNCTFANNVATLYGGGMYNHSLSAGDIDPVVTNCIFWNNKDSEGISETSQIYNNEYSTAVVGYTCIQDDDPDDTSIPYGGAANNNIDDNPLFDRDPNDGGDGWGDSNDDYGSLFVSQDSPCLDTGSNSLVAIDTKDLDEDGDVAEPVPFTLNKHARFIDGDCNGSSIVDRGAHEFGWIYIGDLDGDCDVDMEDFAIFSSHWLTGK